MMWSLKYVFIMYTRYLQHDLQKLNEQKTLENESTGNKDLDEREELLHQIRNKVIFHLYLKGLSFHYLLATISCLLIGYPSIFLVMVVLLG